jgi:hypothetical protein
MNISAEVPTVWDNQPIKFHDSVRSAPKRPAAPGDSEKKPSGFLGKLFGK